MSDATLPFEWIGGRLCLDFANTRSWSEDGDPNERLRAYADVIRWGLDAGSLERSRAKALSKAASGHPEQAKVALDTALRYRRRIHEVFTAVAHGHDAKPEAIDLLNARAQQAYARRQVLPGPDLAKPWVTDWNARRDDLLSPLYPLLIDAVELLLSPQVAVIRSCANDRCGWLFVDTSRNGFRRWCDMKICGNRAKSRRHYARSHG